MGQPPEYPLHSSDGAHRILIVVGAHLSAEQHDRPVAYALRERMLGLLAQRQREGSSNDAAPDVLVCSDVWYLNDESLRNDPTISIGSPGVNALTAYLASRLPSAFVIDDVLMVQFNPEMHPPIACCWGTTPERTARAVGAFVERYAPRFVDTL